VADDFPDFLKASGWQDTDEEHPPGQGVPSYRVVYKTLKTHLPEVRMNWPNLVMRTGYGSAKRGGMRLGEALPMRRKGHWLLPPPGKTVVDGTKMTFHPSGVTNFEFHAWEEEVKELFLVELVLHTTETRPDRRLAEGRSRLASLKTLVELAFGPRLLGALVSEGLGELFPDGHFNRSLESDRVGNEYELDLAAITRDQFSAWTSTTLAKHVQRPLVELQRLSLPCDWYWRSTQTADLVTEYLELWFTVEVIAMPDTTNVRPVRERLAAAFGGTEAEWRDFVGRHAGRRDKLVHGNAKREVEEREVESLRDFVQGLLELELGIHNDERRDSLRRRAGLSAGT